MKQETEIQFCADTGALQPNVSLPHTKEGACCPAEIPLPLYEKLRKGIGTGQFRKITCSLSTDKTILHLTAKPFQTGSNMMVQWERKLIDGKVFHENMTPQMAFETLITLIHHGDFREYHVSGQGVLALKRTKKQKLLINDHWEIGSADSPFQPMTEQGHNREKHYFFRDGEYEPFLYHLGISDQMGHIYDKKRAKFRQINRFIQIIEDIYQMLPQTGTLYVCDLCCGKSYLTFAAYRYLTKAHGRTVDICGMDRKEDVIALCRDTAQTLGYEGMHFISGDINDYQPSHPLHLVLSLHACDIATDMVLYHAQRLQAAVILSTPCCQHELAAQLRKNPNPEQQSHQSAFSQPTTETGKHTLNSQFSEKLEISLQQTKNMQDNSVPPIAPQPGRKLLEPILQQGLLAEKFAAVCTDALRAVWLEAMGYDVAAVELIDPDETPKNILLRACKKPKPDEKRCAQAYEQFTSLCSFLQVHPFLEQYLPAAENLPQT